MKQTDQDIQSAARRRFLANMAAAGAMVPLLRMGVAGAKSLPHLDPNAANAKALHYTNNFKTVTGLKQHKAGAHCGTCMFYHGGKAQWGACSVFAGYDVHIDGWCESWTARSS